MAAPRWPAPAACEPAVEFCATCADLQDMWDRLGRGDWMLWQAAASLGPVGHVSRRVLMEAARQCLGLLGDADGQAAAAAWLAGSGPDLSRWPALAAIAIGTRDDARPLMGSLAPPYTSRAVAVVMHTLYPVVPDHREAG